MGKIKQFPIEIFYNFYSAKRMWIKIFNKRNRIKLKEKNSETGF